MSNGHSTTGNASGLETGLARTIKVGKQELLIVKMVHTRGRDVEEGDYPVVVVKGQRKVVVGTGEAAELRSFSAFGGTVRAKTNRSPATVHELPERAVVLTPKTWAIMKSIAAVSGLEPEQVIEEALPMIAEAQGINETLYQRIIDRTLKASSEST